MIRDLSGQTGLKQAKAVFLRDLGWGAGRNQRDQGMSRGERPDVGWRKLAPVVLTNAVLFAILALAGHPALYLLWLVAWLTTYRLVTRIRSIAEHALTPDANDALNNTRTTVARWWERLLIAPNRVNYHLEHHLIMTVPHYKLPRFHRLLRERGVLDRACVDDRLSRRAAQRGVEGRLARERRTPAPTAQQRPAPVRSARAAAPARGRSVQLAPQPAPNGRTLASCRCPERGRPASRRLVRERRDWEGQRSGRSERNPRRTE